VDRRPKLGSYEFPLAVLQLMIKRQEDAFIPGALAPAQRPNGSPRLILICRFPMNAHNSAASGNL
jgi:hypothetical protein